MSPGPLGSSPVDRYQWHGYRVEDSQGSKFSRHIRARSNEPVGHQSAFWGNGEEMARANLDFHAQYMTKGGLEIMPQLKYDDSMQRPGRLDDYY
ncbi:hypothetical protein AJ80_06700 [Polytolypa hystricis UAMH7299]|uniref:Uncharacterized protein n=1 Tax=Polytolypa hystricis (strain UAMH7299) TaxID=1447883 RepID=A0A2B7XU95_POLH7|nr:hypothetical protein AJ80_06700 [Polytolypa hystricis UAMH7299]